jgi:hypothetical protein
MCPNQQTGLETVLTVQLPTFSSAHGIGLELSNMIVTHLYLSIGKGNEAATTNKLSTMIPRMLGKSAMEGKRTRQHRNHEDKQKRCDGANIPAVLTTGFLAAPRCESTGWTNGQDCGRLQTRLWGRRTCALHPLDLGPQRPERLSLGC